MLLVDANPSIFATKRFFSKIIIKHYNDLKLPAKKLYKGFKKFHKISSGDRHNEFQNLQANNNNYNL